MKSVIRKLLGDLAPKRQYTIVFFQDPSSTHAHSLDHDLRAAIEQAGHRCFIWPEEPPSYGSRWYLHYRSSEFLREVADHLGKRPKADLILTTAYGSYDFNEAVVRLAVFTNIGPVMALRYTSLTPDSAPGLLQAGADAVGDLPTEGVDPWVVVTQIEAFLAKRA